jgi:hypothetical protein
MATDPADCAGTDAVRLAEIMRAPAAETIVLEKVGPRQGQGSVSSWALCRATMLGGHLGDARHHGYSNRLRRSGGPL